MLIILNRVHSAYYEILVFDVLAAAFDIMQIYPKLLEKPHLKVVIHRAFTMTR